MLVDLHIVTHLGHSSEPFVVVQTAREVTIVNAEDVRCIHHFLSNVRRNAHWDHKGLITIVHGGVLVD